MKFLKKIKSLEEILAILPKLRAQGKRIITTNGSYDIIHSGHVKSLYESKSQGDVLVVGVNSDKSVKIYKSKDRPIISEKDRMETLAGLGCVDYVFKFDETTPHKFIEKIKPDVHTNSSDYGENCVEKDAVLKVGARLHLLKKYKGMSTSEIIKKILNIYCQPK